MIFRDDSSSRTTCRRHARWGGVALCLAVTGCAPAHAPQVRPLPGPMPLGRAEPDMTNGRIGAVNALGPVQYSYGRDAVPRVPASGQAGGVGTIVLNFADTDIRDAVSQILTDILHVNYAIDPAVRGQVTLHTASPLTAGQVMPALQLILSQVHATLIRSNGLYRIVPAQAEGGTAQGAGTPGLAEGDALGGSVMVPLRYAAAGNLARALQPFVQAGARVTPVESANAVMVSGEPSARNTLVEVIRAFDVDWLASQSYALLPVESGSARDMATALQTALHGSGGALAQIVQVLPLARVNAVLVVSRTARYVDDARRLFALIERNRRATLRSWHVFYVQNSNVNDVAYTLQQAFTPGDVTAMPPEASTQTGQQGGIGANAMGGGLAGGGLAGGGLNSGGLGGNNSMTGGLGNANSLFGGGQQGGTTPAAGQQPGGGQQAASSNPLLGGLDSTAGNEGRSQGMRIISNAQHNAILIYATEQESDAVEQMMRKIDVMPLQVRIDAVIAEVQLNDALQYGTQFFFKSGGINGVLSGNSQTITTGTLATAAFSHTLPGFIIGGASGGGAPFAIDALQNVTTVHVLSSPQLMVQDNKAARLQVGQLVPIQIGSQSSTIGTSIYNQFTYQPTGVIMQVTPHVTDAGLVTLDVVQEVSSVTSANSSTSSATTNPTFNDRTVSSRVVVQDGQTVGLAGLITDTSTRTNSGIPWLKNIPVLGVLAGNQNNNRQRTELLILITPHVMHDQRDAVALMEDLRDSHPNAAVVPDELEMMGATGNADPQQHLRHRVGLSP
ncbi:type II secretion system secretin GspD [Gluconacetobacter azotocaptans]|uniref:Type II secretion system secretin GspD n=1 Tax=Gluconacetobacter azotocaptans TaxID=142834 RepID=A0A7W4PEQ8_9PROT|nr:type II secretion system secretin GspD [Gluconacetobacter azotocaptans]MBB2191008.1 type II secretion system secretin GspD [Gluconacetobacter azotocaptans]GBQ29566.1 general secretion pathway protein D [Gluconacetobacter azotocaptans DSM 13594]